MNKTTQIVRDAMKAVADQVRTPKCVRDGLVTPKHVKCNCGHTAKDHFENSGFCNKCGCTWYYPNDKWILKQKKKKQ